VFDVTSVYLIRHAQAQGNLEQRFQGCTDTRLTPQGEKQVRFVAQRMRAIPLDAVYTSPLRRAWETAQGIAKLHELSPTVHEGLSEIDGGEMENRPFEELERLYSEPFRQFIQEPHKFTGVGGGESMQAVYQRMRGAVLELVRRHAGQCLAIVSHGAALRCFMCYASGLPLERMNELPWGDNTAVSHVTFNQQLEPLVHSLFDSSHLHIALLPVTPRFDSDKGQVIK